MTEPVASAMVTSAVVAAGVGLGGLGALKRTGGRVDDADGVLAQCQTGEGVLAIGVRHGRDRVAVLVQDGGAVPLEECNGHARVRALTVIGAKRGIGIVVQLAGDRVASRQRHRRRIIRRLIADLILLLDRGRIGDDRTGGGSVDGDSDEQRARRVLLDHL